MYEKVALFSLFVPLGALKGIGSHGMIFACIFMDIDNLGGQDEKR